MAFDYAMQIGGGENEVFIQCRNHHPIPVRGIIRMLRWQGYLPCVSRFIGKRVTAGMLRYMFHTLYFMQQEGILSQVDEIDFRSGEAVYRRKGV